MGRYMYIGFLNSNYIMSIYMHKAVFAIQLNTQETIIVKTFPTHPVVHPIPVYLQGQSTIMKI